MNFSLGIKKAEQQRSANCLDAIKVGANIAFLNRHLLHESVKLHVFPQAGCRSDPVTCSAALATPVVSQSSNTLALATAMAGSGNSNSHAVVSTDAPAGSAGSFTGGASSGGIDKGMVLATGSTTCVAGPDDKSN
ncbi:hypothetical protein H5407_19225 [Mitsuaria sp. WAJ17]|uniref:hypothetical protein n=1 Tax=Mitsuaria sp. WAJ17 TaxID=2761452 RepID=UPI0016037AA4|nr:hypothetical protein [Mitsuaria sp. WAJ17]MBB2487373.1 hypothetical protein [Mitsuaria sp. WAJ17]